MKWENKMMISLLVFFALMIGLLAGITAWMDYMEEKVIKEIMASDDPLENCKNQHIFKESWCYEKVAQRLIVDRLEVGK